MLVCDQFCNLCGGCLHSTTTHASRSSQLVYRLPCGHMTHDKCFDNALGTNVEANCAKCNEPVDLRPGGNASILRTTTTQSMNTTFPISEPSATWTTIPENAATVRPKPAASTQQPGLAGTILTGLVSGALFLRQAMSEPKVDSTHGQTAHDAIRSTEHSKAVVSSFTATPTPSKRETPQRTRIVESHGPSMPRNDTPWPERIPEIQEEELEKTIIHAPRGYSYDILSPPQTHKVQLLRSHERIKQEAKSDQNQLDEFRESEEPRRYYWST